MSAALFPMPSPPPFEGEPGENEAAVNATIRELEDAGLLTGKHRATVVTLRATARAVDRGLQYGKVSVATAQLVRMLLEGLDSLPEPAVETGNVFDALSATIERLTKDALK